MSKYVSWHVHSVASARDGLLKIEDLVRKCKDNDMVSSITDHGSIAGWISYHNHCKKAGIKPVFGNEIYIHPHRERLFEIRKELEDKNIDPEKKRRLQIEKEEKAKYNHIVVVAKNKHGFHNLIELSNEAYLNGFYRFPLSSYKTLFNLPKDKSGDRGLIVSSACLASPLSQYILKDKMEEAKDWILMMHEEFQKNFYLEIQAVNMDEQRLVNKAILNFSKTLKIPTLLANDAHYLSDEYAKAHERFLLLQGKEKVADIGKKVWRIKWEMNTGEVKRKKYDAEDPDVEWMNGIKISEINKDDTIVLKKIKDKANKGQEIIKESAKILEKDLVNKVWLIEADDLSFKTEKEIRAKVALQHPEITNVDEIIDVNYSIYDKIENIELDGESKLPKIPESYDNLVKKTGKALATFLKTNKVDYKVYIARLKYELEVIHKFGFEEYFLILADVFDYGKSKGISFGAGRGSAAGSLVAFLLGIHRVDPILWNMQFERFLSPVMGSEEIVCEDSDGKIKTFHEDALVKLKSGKSKKAKLLVEGDEILA